MSLICLSKIASQSPVCQVNDNGNPGTGSPVSVGIPVGACFGLLDIRPLPCANPVSSGPLNLGANFSGARASRRPRDVNLDERPADRTDGLCHLASASMESLAFSPIM